MESRKTIPFTQAGYDKFVAEYESLESRRPSLVVELTRARDLGDRSENGAYKAARQALSRADSRLRFLKKILDKAFVASPKQKEYVEIGSTVTVETVHGAISFEIVGEFEADPMNRKISFRSPVGQALLRKHLGDKIVVQIPAGALEYTVKHILTN